MGWGRAEPSGWDGDPWGASVGGRWGEMEVQPKVTQGPRAPGVLGERARHMEG